MPAHPAIATSRTTVITRAANSIGLAAADRFARLGMTHHLANLPSQALDPDDMAEPGSRDG